MNDRPAVAQPPAEPATDIRPVSMGDRGKASDAPIDDAMKRAVMKSVKFIEPATDAEPVAIFVDTEAVRRLALVLGAALGQVLIDCCDEIDRLRADAERQATPGQVLELCEALETRRILEEIKKVATLHPADDMPTPFQSAWQTCCEEIFFRATGEQWNMDEDARKFARAANDPAARAAMQPSGEVTP